MNEGSSGGRWGLQGEEWGSLQKDLQYSQEFGLFLSEMESHWKDLKLESYMI